ncbi:hypothetical protein M408DRAFT_63762 [Serendipita vermifera MAFF 305830]|uniref:Holocytochrome c-type synthase n=1 Tax=Serendipita vermifera MAFF 305830 TaxID=933852 RepID=A0A0C2X0G2_SERVB|nr:hypothetical protein M408DRAFT_63762 [Serendipita vermifera MAFF 305830]
MSDQSKTNEDAASKCPVDHSTRATWQNLASAPPPHGLPPRAAPLSTQREISSIPRASSDADETEGGKWVYPSEQQFYAALLRKHQSSSADASSSSHGEENAGLKTPGAVEVDASGAAVTNGNVVKPPRASDMRVVVPIHNAVNEQTWAKVLAWEANQGGESAGWVFFLGFAFYFLCLSFSLFSLVCSYQRPFDRHDWVVDRCGTRVRYVIDYYTGKLGPSATGGNPLSFYIDARPALDSWEGVRMRFTRFWTGVFSGR